MSKAFVFESGFASPIAEHGEVACSEDQVLTTFRLSPKSYELNQLRYDLRKLKGHALLERDGSGYAYRLTPKGVDLGNLCAGA